MEGMQLRTKSYTTSITITCNRLGFGNGTKHRHSSTDFFTMTWEGLTKAYIAMYITFLVTILYVP